MRSRRPQLHLILLLLAYYCSTHTAANGDNGIKVQCLPDHASSLLQLKHSFHDPNLSSWQHGTDCCHWEGVGCDKASGQVITLDLGDRDLWSTTGLSPALFNLTSLTNLSLARNDFGMASLPNFGFERLTNLLSLNLSNARFFGQIPIGISHLKNLLTLDLSSDTVMSGDPYNYLYLQDPSFQTFVSNFSNLRDLYLDGVQILSGGSTWSAALADSVSLLQNLGLSSCALDDTSIHPSFSKLHFLATIDLGDNGITGHVPEFFAELPFLQKLVLSGNEFEGQFPTKIFQLENLRHLDVFNNPSLSVQLPDFRPENSLEWLNLVATNFSGAIPDSFHHLKSLKFLSLSNIGSPKQPTTSIANLTSLNTLCLLGSGIEKPMLSWIERLQNLTRLVLFEYNFSGPIPWWIRNCTHLMGLRLLDCNLSGEIPSWIGNLTKLSYLDLSNNQLSGKIPMVLFALSSLERLSLWSNELYGTLDDIPDPLSSLLQVIELSDNNFTGHIPKSYFDLTGLQALYLGSNRFEGTVELSLLWKLKAFHSLTLSNNMLSVKDVKDGYPFPYLRNIRRLHLASCNITKIPVALRYANELSSLDLSNNRMDGVIPSWIWVIWKDTITELDLSNNMFTSLENSPSVVHMHNLEFLNLSSNKLHGSVPIPLTAKSKAFLDYSKNSFSSIIPDFGRYLPKKTLYLDLSKNKLSGHIPRSICTQQYLEILDLSYNNFNGVVPSCLMQGSNSLSMLKLRENHLHGMLPENIGEGCMLQTIDLNNNRIEGKIPKSLSNCHVLELLDVGNNQIVGSFPSWLGVLPQLRVLVLRSNQLNGTIRDMKGEHRINNYFASLQILDLASNNFSGNLPNEWFNELKAMMINVSEEGQVLGHYTNSTSVFYHDTVTITFKGFYLSFTKILSTFEAIDFSNNSFDGPVPKSIGRLVSLRGLNMSHNNLVGQIPFQYRNLSQLESMDLSCNQIAGEIPPELISLNSLGWLNLSYNNLSGRIPQGNQFSTFSNSSFEGNAGLCGVPLSKQCDNRSSIAPSAVAPPESNGLWQDKVGVILLFAFVGLGFGVGFALSLLLRFYYRMEEWVCKQA